MLFLNNLYRKDVLAFGVKDNSCKRLTGKHMLKLAFPISKGHLSLSPSLILIKKTQHKHYQQYKN